MAEREVTMKELLAGVKLPAGEEYTLIVKMGRHKTLLVEGSVFAFDSAFPAAGILLHLKGVQEEIDAQSDARIMVFGHTDVTGSEDYNKKLSDKRAKAALAMIKRDLNLLDAVAADEDWGTQHYQVMLRVLGCNPGAIDGVAGDMTKAAVRGFQRGYNANVYHEGPDSLPRAHGDLTVDGVLGPKTKAALRDAYVANSPCRLDDSRLNDPSFAGCSELNPISDKDEENRRVMVAFIGDDGPDRSEYPCEEGNIGACPKDSKNKMRCPFYRAHFPEHDELDEAPFFDFRWLREKSGAAHLSALTTLPDGPARFTIYRYQSEITDPMANSVDSDAKPAAPGDELGVVAGEIRGGVAYARWTPPEGFDPFDYLDWLVDHDHDLDLMEGDEPSGGAVDSQSLIDAKGMHPPVFMVESGEHWGFSFPPSEDLDNIRITQESTGPGVAVGYDAGLVAWQAIDGKTAPTSSLPADVGILALLMASREVTPEDGEAGAGEATA